ncbi:MAG: lipocalin family protein [Bacteroidales bacterium]
MPSFFRHLFPAEHPELPTYTGFQLEKYMGKWYEIARFPNRYERGLDCTMAIYTRLDAKKVLIMNQGRVARRPNVIRKATGTATMTDPADPGRITASFIKPFRSHICIIDILSDYRYALVGSPSRKYLWILSRQTNMPEADFNHLVEKAASLGFPVEKLTRTKQINTP